MTHKRITDLCLCALMAAVISVCAWLTIPAAVPFTLQLLGVYLALGLLGGRRGFCAVALYLLLGAVGLPVYAGFQGGFGVLAGATGGYLWGFLALAGLSWLLERRTRGRPLALGLVWLAGLAALYALGTGWFLLVYARTKGAVSVGAALGLTVLPFVLPDLVKLGLALLLTRRLRRVLGG